MNIHRIVQVTLLLAIALVPLTKTSGQQDQGWVPTHHEADKEAADMQTYCINILASPPVQLPEHIMTRKLCTRMIELKHFTSSTGNENGDGNWQVEHQRLVSDMVQCQQNISALVHDVEDAKAYLAVCVADSRVARHELATVEEKVRNLETQNQQLVAEKEQCQQEVAGHLEAAQDAKSRLAACQADLVAAARDTRLCQEALTESTAVKNEIWSRHESCIVQASATKDRNDQLEEENLRLQYEIERFRNANNPFQVFAVVWKSLKRIWRAILPKRLGGED